MRPQFAHVIDLMPTILQAAGIEVPERGGRGGPAADSTAPASSARSRTPRRPRCTETQYFEMMGSRSIYHEGWKATTNHISTGVLDEEELAIGSRDFAEDRWELFDLTRDFSEAHRPCPKRSPSGSPSSPNCGTAEADRNQVLPISDGMLDRFGGFIPPAWPAGPSRDLPSRGRDRSHDESVPLLWGGFRMTADVDAGPATPDGVICALGDWFGGYALYWLDGAA